MPHQKPGDTITPASFAVAPELLGKPLAPPSRRAAAMAIDLALLGILVNAGGVFFGVAAAFALWRASARTDFAAGRPRLRRAFRFAAAGVLFVVIVTNWGFWTRPIERLASSGDDAGDEDADSAGFVSGRGDLKTGLATMGYFVALRNARNEPEARSIARRLVKQLHSQGASAADLADVQEGFKDKGNAGALALPPVAVAALKGAIQAEFPGDTARPRVTLDRDSLATAYVRALARSDAREATDSLGQMMGLAFARDTLSDLNTRVAELGADNRKLARRLRADSVKAASSPAGIMATVSDAGGEIVRLLRKAGLGFGWLGLYFTGFVAMMRGQTPGKWLMRIRIVRLDGRPMGWWAALERFGGYAASAVTALGGFFQILWDKNRQAMHDKIAETVVIRV